MNNEYEIQLSGPFDVTDSSGCTWKVESIHISDEGYGIIDVYVALDLPDDDTRLHEDRAVIGQILSRLRSLGYAGPDFGPGADDMQGCGFIVLEAPEEFGTFAAAKGWRNLADDYLDDEADEAGAMNDGDAARDVYFALMQRLRLG